MIITRFLRWCGFRVWTEAELIKELTGIQQGAKPAHDPGMDIDRIIREEK